MARDGMRGPSGEIYVGLLEGGMAMIADDKLTPVQTGTDQFGNEFNYVEGGKRFLLGNNTIIVENRLTHCKDQSVIFTFPSPVVHVNGSPVVYYSDGENTTRCVNGSESFIIQRNSYSLYDVGPTSWSFYDNDNCLFIRSDHGEEITYPPNTMPFCFGQITATFNMKGHTFDFKITNYYGNAVDFPSMSYKPRFAFQFMPEKAIRFFDHYMVAPSTMVIHDNDGTFTRIGVLEDISVYRINHI